MNIVNIGNDIITLSLDLKAGEARWKDTSRENEL